MHWRKKSIFIWDKKWTFYIADLVSENMWERSWRWENIIRQNTINVKQ